MRPLTDTTVHVEVNGRVKARIDGPATPPGSTEGTYEMNIGPVTIAFSHDELDCVMDDLNFDWLGLNGKAVS